MVMANTATNSAVPPEKILDEMFSPRLDEATLTSIFPRRMVARRRCGLESIFATSLLGDEGLVAICLTLSLLKLKRAVSEPEKKAEKQSKMARPISLAVMKGFVESLRGSFYMV
jgi:hypothetical protein